ncbi:MAG: ABC transporter permease [Nitriliruptoraceae bacterium]
MDGVRSWIGFVAGDLDGVLARTLEHLSLVAGVMVAATLFSVLLGIVLMERPVARQVALGTAGVLLTIPSLALFAVFIPLVGIGNRPAQLALFLYAILPILRNTVTGLAGVDEAVVESARGMGMGPVQQLLSVRVPLAWPVVMAGVRVSTQLVTGIAAIAVLVGGGGLGSYIQRGLTSLGNPFSIERVWTGTVAIILLALVLDLTLGLIGRRTTSPGLR